MQCWLLIALASSPYSESFGTGTVREMGWHPSHPRLSLCQDTEVLQGQQERGAGDQGISDYLSESLYLDLASGQPCLSVINA